MKQELYRPIVKDKLQLKKPTQKVDVATEDLDALKEVLLANLLYHECIGLAANQIGLDKSACVLNVQDTLFLVNPRIVSKEGLTPYVEACASFPKKVVKTKRAIRIVVEADNVEGQLHFGPTDEEASLENLDLMESVAVQHEIGHLNGETMFDHELKGETFVHETKPLGRNDIVFLRKENELLSVKNKHVSKFTAKGYSVATPEDVYELSKNKKLVNA